MIALMKKTGWAFFLALLLPVSAFAMDLEGRFIVTGGVNIGALLPHFIGDDDMDDTFHIGGRLQADYMLTQHFGIGLESGFSAAEVGDTDFSIGTVPILARFSWHPFSFEKFDPYLVLKAGYGFGFWTDEGDDYDWTDISGGFVWGINLGTRFFFSQNIGIFIEAGYECLDIGWNHPGMELEKWEESVSARTFAVIGLTFTFGK